MGTYFWKQNTLKMGIASELPAVNPRPMLGVE